MNQSLKISIVVPNYNGAATIACTLQSLIDQGYPCLEIIVVDGASTDNSVDIIKQFEPHIAWWVSEKDAGQTQAINKGLAHATGEVVNWLCSDDRLMPGALATIDRCFRLQPEVDVLAGRCLIEYTHDSSRTRYSQPTDEKVTLLPASVGIPQPSCFYRKKLLSRTHPLDESYHYAMDVELWNYFKAQGAKWWCIEDVLSVFQVSGFNKTSTGGEKILEEKIKIYRKYSKELIPLVFWYVWLRVPLIRMKRSGTTRISRLSHRLDDYLARLLSLGYGADKVRSLDWSYLL